MEEEMHDVELSPFGHRESVQLMLSTHDMETFHKRQEQEAILELRKRAITRWLKQLPLPEEETDEKRKTMWTSFQSFGEGDDSVIGMKREQKNSGELDFVEETPLDAFEKKSMPSENDCPIRNLRSMKRGGQDRQLHRSLSNTTAFQDIHRPPEPPSQFTKKWNVVEETSTMTAPVLEVEEQPLKTIEDAMMRPCPHSGDKGETSGSDGWSVLSDDADDPDHKEDTAYGGSSFGSRKQRSGEQFHRRYKCSSPMFSPPTSQCIEPHASTEMRPLTPADLTAENGSRPVQDPEGEWWLPKNLFFKGFMGMICNAGWMEEEVASSTDEEKRDEDSIAMHDRVLRRLVHRKMTPYIRRFGPRLPTRARLHLRMQQAKRCQDIKSEEIHCALEHPFDMKKMIPDGAESTHPLTAPEVKIIEYLPPSSIADLSDFECYMGPVLSALVNGRNYPHHAHPLVGHCQNWLLEKLLCFLGGRPTHS